MESQFWSQTNYSQNQLLKSREISSLKSFQKIYLVKNCFESNLKLRSTNLNSKQALEFEMFSFHEFNSNKLKLWSSFKSFQGNLVHLNCKAVRLNETIMNQHFYKQLNDRLKSWWTINSSRNDQLFFPLKFERKTLAQIPQQFSTKKISNKLFNAVWLIKIVAYFSALAALENLLKWSLETWFNVSLI